MTTVTNLSQAYPCVVSDPLVISELRWFQINRYFESGLLDESPTTLPHDPTVEASTYFGVFDGDKVQATARIVRDLDGLPMLKYHTLFPEAESLLLAHSGSVAEISRLAVCDGTPRFRNLALLAREFLRFGLENPHASLLIASVERPLVRILNRILGVPLDIIGPAIDQYGSYNGETVPILIDTVQCLASFERHEGRMWKFFLEELVIDLTAPTVDHVELGQVAS